MSFIAVVVWHACVTYEVYLRLAGISGVRGGASGQCHWWLSALPCWGGYAAWRSLHIPQATPLSILRCKLYLCRTCLVSETVELKCLTRSTNAGIYYCARRVFFASGTASDMTESLNACVFVRKWWTLLIAMPWAYLKLSWHVNNQGTMRQRSWGDLTLYPQHENVTNSMLIYEAYCKKKSSWQQLIFIVPLRSGVCVCVFSFICFGFVGAVRDGIN